MSLTFRDQIDAFYDTVADDDSSQVYPLENVEKFINAGEGIFLAEKDNWPFLRDTLLRTTVADTVLNGAFATIDTTLDLAITTTWPTASSTTYAAIVEGDILETWTGKSATQLTGVTGLQLAHASGKNLAPLYILPSTVAKIARVKVDGTEFDYIDEDHYSEYSDKFTIIHDNYLRLPSGDGGKVLEIPYYKAPIELSLDADESLLPDKYRLAPVYYALGKMLLATDELAKARQYAYFNERTLVWEGVFGELLYAAKREYDTKTSRNKRRVSVQKRLQSK